VGLIAEGEELDMDRPDILVFDEGRLMTDNRFGKVRDNFR
jgi:hypothetical protein